MVTEHPPSSAVHRIEDLVFAEVINETGQPESLRLDIYLPARPAPAPLRTAILFHGGGFKVGNDKRQRYIVMLAQILVEADFGVVAPDYRVRQEPGPDWTEAVRDAVADGRLAIDWVRRHAADYGLDTGRLVLGGGSAGGMLVTNLVHDPAQPLTPADHVTALINLWGSPKPNARLFRALNPACPPTFIVHGTADQLVDYQLSVQLQQDLAALGVPCHLLTLPGAPHTPWMHMDQIAQTLLEFLKST